MGLGSNWKIRPLVGFYEFCGFRSCWIWAWALVMNLVWARGKIVILPQVWIMHHGLQPNC